MAPNQMLMIQILRKMVILPKQMLTTPNDHDYNSMPKSEGKEQSFAVSNIGAYFM